MARNYRKYRFNYVLIFCLVLFTLSFMSFFTTDASAANQATLEWSPNSEPDLEGYKVFVREEGQSYDYADSSWEGIDTTATIYNLDETKTYYFVARAFDIEGFESGNSNEVSREGIEPSTY
ncbi:MAG: fibronectin type III domain-containing protein [Deltaproteobacteria bacterium]|nr:fibronectin type III domain-containing protein [Deltaproteobacteria bacterium]